MCCWTFLLNQNYPFGQRIDDISAEQAVVKAQKQLVKELDSAILVANDQKYLDEDVAVETVIPDRIAIYRAKINELSNLEIRESYAK